MADIAGFPDYELQFTKDARVVDEGEVARLLDLLAGGTVTDLFVFCHGWNNDMAEARTLNRDFFPHVRAVLEAGHVEGLGERRFAVLTVLWPSKKFADSDLIPGGAASLESPEVLYVRQQLENLKAVFQDPRADAVLDRAKQLLPVLEDSAAAQKEYADLLRSLLPQPQSAQEDAAAVFLDLPGDELLDRLKAPVLPSVPPPADDQGGAASIGELPAPGEGGAAGLRDAFGRVSEGVGNLAGRVTGTVGRLAGNVATVADTFVNRTTAAASNLANLITYYQMKDRAGLIGVTGLNPVLRHIRERVSGLKIHLIGHSFGGRLVTAAADGPEGQEPLRPDSMTLLQAAFSHNGFARLYDGRSDGFFRKVITEHKVSGPILITCSVMDMAVGLAYPLASRVAGQQASALVGGPGDLYGGMGRNGAQKTPEALDGQLFAVGSPYTFKDGHLYNLHADTIIGGHSDICKDEVAYALLTAIATT